MIYSRCEFESPSVQHDSNRSGGKSNRNYHFWIALPLVLYQHYDHMPGRYLGRCNRYYNRHSHPLVADSHHDYKHNASVGIESQPLALIRSILLIIIDYFRILKIPTSLRDTRLHGCRICSSSTMTGMLYQGPVGLSPYLPPPFHRYRVLSQ